MSDHARLARVRRLRERQARAALHPVAEGTFRPRGGRYDVRRVRRRPVRALRGGASGLVAAFRLTEGAVEITILARDRDCRAADIAWAAGVEVSRQMSKSIGEMCGR